VASYFYDESESAARLIVTAASAAQRAADFILGQNNQECVEG